MEPKQGDGVDDVITWKTWDDGYRVRSMRRSEASIVQDWYCGLAILSRADLDVCLEVYPAGPGFYIGEKDGEVVASAIRIPWGDNVYYGSYYYVAEKYRRAGYGTRLRDEVARGHVGDNTLCIDAVLGKVAENNRSKFGYVDAFTTGRFQGVAKDDYGVVYHGKIVKAEDVSFDDVIAYDNRHFVGRDCPHRRAFLKRWVALADGATYLALNDGGDIIGMCCRRKCIQEGHQQVGPLYADNAHVAQALLQRTNQDVVGDHVTINIWYPNKAAEEMVKTFEMKNIFDVQRMHINKNPNEYKDTVFALTSIDVCGF